MMITEVGDGDGNKRLFLVENYYGVDIYLSIRVSIWACSCLYSNRDLNNKSKNGECEIKGWISGWVNEGSRPNNMYFVGHKRARQTDRTFVSPRQTVSMTLVPSYCHPLSHLLWFRIFTFRHWSFSWHRQSRNPLPRHRFAAAAVPLGRHPPPLLPSHL